ncbi:hypothetical protein ENKNEFLB_01332 [Nocardioides aquaticus]|uniref:Uncharacterized protein n=1 Tax=Nocardioides aquaticus TaxID=160826 RepID=A0ABX8EFS2_9ACTN|nr:hypothetical protein ENKNEFLB_01332 [Nocardioides aquaticus]
MHMAEQQQTALQRWGSQKRPWWFWVLLVVVVVPLIGLGLLSLLQMGQSPEDLRIELDARYVEEIDIETTPDGSGGYRDVVVIDGESRYDCSEKDGFVTCDDEPRPTEQ